MVRHDLTLDLNKDLKRLKVPRIVVRVGDEATQEIALHLTRDGAPYEVPDGSVVRLQIRTSDDRIIRAMAEGSGSEWTCVIPPQAASCHGVCKRAYFAIYLGKETTPIETTQGFDLETLPGTTDAEFVRSYDREMHDKLDYFTEFVEDAEDAERQRIANEQERQSNELDRQEAESQRRSDERKREAAEESRVAEERLRVEAETQRADAEGKRQLAESERQTDEDAREEAELRREAAESSRRSAESDRVAADLERESRQAKNDADQAHNNALATRLTQVYCTQPGIDYDPETMLPIIDEPLEGTVYLVLRPDASDDSPDRFVEYMWAGDRWEPCGSTAAVVDPITTDQIDQIVDEGQTLQGTQTLTSYGLSYYDSKIKSAIRNATPEIIQPSTIDAIAEGTPASELSDLGFVERYGVEELQSKLREWVQAEARIQVSQLLGQVALSNGGLAVDLDPEQDPDALATAQQSAREAIGAASQDAVSLVKASTIWEPGSVHNIRYMGGCYVNYQGRVFVTIPVSFDGSLVESVTCKGCFIAIGGKEVFNGKPSESRISTVAMENWQGGIGVYLTVTGTTANNAAGISGWFEVTMKP